MQPALKTQINKTDRNDARGIVRMMRAGFCRPVHVKTLRSQKLQMLLTHRKLQSLMSALCQKRLRGAMNLHSM
jgi:transposase